MKRYFAGSLDDQYPLNPEERNEALHGNKIRAIKMLRERAGIGLAEAKHSVEFASDDTQAVKYQLEHLRRALSKDEETSFDPTPNLLLVAKEEIARLLRRLEDKDIQITTLHEVIQKVTNR